MRIAAAFIIGLLCVGMGCTSLQTDATGELEQSSLMSSSSVAAENAATHPSDFPSEPPADLSFWDGSGAETESGYCFPNNPICCSNNGSCHCCCYSDGHCSCWCDQPPIHTP